MFDAFLLLKECRNHTLGRSIFCPTLLYTFTPKWRSLGQRASLLAFPVVSLADPGSLGSLCGEPCWAPCAGRERDNLPSQESLYHCPPLQLRQRSNFMLISVHEMSIFFTNFTSFTWKPNKWEEPMQPHSSGQEAHSWWGLGWECLQAGESLMGGIWPWKLCILSFNLGPCALVLQELALWKWN